MTDNTRTLNPPTPPSERKPPNRSEREPERRSGNERRAVPRWIQWTRENDRRGKALDHS